MEVDVAIIGAGSAGLTARRAAMKAGAQRVIVVEGGPYGTTCARVGCMPSKLLIAAADAAQHVRDSAAFGVRHGGLEIDPVAVMDRVKRERDRFAGFVVDAVENWPDDQRLRGYCRFVGPRTLEVYEGEAKGTRVEANAVVVATGTSPVVPTAFQSLSRGPRGRLLTSDDVFELETLPASVAVVGAGVIGLELGQALHRLGVRVALFNRNDRVGILRDPRLVAESRRLFGAELDLHLGTLDLQASEEGEGVRLRWTDGEGQAREEDFERVLLAVGRAPNVKRLNLEAANLPLGPGGVPLFDHRTMQCGDSPVFLAGDVNAERQLLHEAADEGRYAGQNAARFPRVRAHPRKTPLAIVFSHPQLAIVGTPGPQPDDAREFGEVSYEDQGRARVMGANRGHVRIWARRECGTLEGAEMIGPGVEHTAHLLAWAVQSGMTVPDALAMPFYHPVLEEGIRTALRDLASKLKLAGRPHPLECGPGD